ETGVRAAGGWGGQVLPAVLEPEPGPGPRARYRVAGAAEVDGDPVADHGGVVLDGQPGGGPEDVHPRLEGEGGVVGHGDAGVDPRLEGGVGAEAQRPVAPEGWGRDQLVRGEQVLQ